VCGKLWSGFWTATRSRGSIKEHLTLQCHWSGWSWTETVFDLYRSTLFTRCRSSNICKSTDLLSRFVEVHDRLLRLHLRHRSSAAPTVRRLPSAACAATLPFDVWSSGLFCGQPGALELVTRLPSRSDAFCWQFSSWPENSSFLVLLAYTAH